MKKTYLVAISVFILLALLFFALRPTNFKNKFNEVIEELDSYYMEGVMEVMQGEDIKSFDITVSYEKRDDQDYFRVSQFDRNLNQLQIILRNNEGVYVMTPSLNQVFKFKGEWPYNSPKPYLFHSVLDVLNSEYEMKKEKDGYLITSAANYPNAPQLKTQEIKLDKELKPIYVNVMNAQMVSEIKVTFSKVEFNKQFDEDYFNMQKNLDEGKSNSKATSSSYSDLPLYPMEVFDTKLASSSQVSVNGDIKHILSFEGEKAFTLVQVNVRPEKEATVQEVNGELVDLGAMFGVYDGNSLTLYAEGIEYTVYSQNLSVDEMMQVATSVQVAAMK